MIPVAPGPVDTFTLPGQPRFSMRESDHRLIGRVELVEDGVLHGFKPKPPPPPPPPTPPNSPRPAACQQATCEIGGAA